MKKPKQSLDYIPEVGDVVEVWIRDSPRHKYQMESSFVQVLTIIKEEDVGDTYYHLTVKKSESFAISSRHSNGFNGSTGF